LWSKNYTLEVGANQQNILRYWTKYASFRALFSPLSPYVAEKPLGDCATLGPIYSAFILHETSYIPFVDTLSPFEATRLQLTAVLENGVFPSPNF